MAVLIHSFEADSGIHCLAVTKNDRIITGSRSGKITTWDLKKRKELHSFQSQHRHLNSLTVTADGRMIISGGSGELKVWNLKNRSLDKEIKTYVDEANVLLTTPEGMCISGHEYGGLLVWDIAEGKRIKTLDRAEIWMLSRIMADPDGITAAAITPDGNTLITGTYYGTLYFWNLRTYERIHSFPGHTTWITGIVLLPDHRHGMSAAFDGSVKTWSLDKPESAYTTFQGKAAFHAIALLADSRHVVWGTEDGTLFTWDSKQKKITDSFKAHSNQINAAALLKSGLLLTVSEDKTLKAWDMEKTA